MIFSQLFSFRNTFAVTNGLDPDHYQRFVYQNCLQMLSAVDIVITIKVRANIGNYETSFVLFDLIIYIPFNNFSVKSGWVFLGWTSTSQGLMCVAQGHNTMTLVRLNPTTLGLV